MITRQDAKKIAAELHSLLRKDVKQHLASIVEQELDDDFICHEEAARILGLSPSGLYQRKDIPYAKPGKRRLYSKTELIRIIRNP